MDTYPDPSYPAVWHAVLTQMLGWSEERVRRFVQGWSAPEYGLHDPGFYHHHALEYVEHLLIPDGVGPASGRERVEFQHRFSVTVFPGANQPGSALASYDWVAARERAQSFLSQYGASLPTPDMVTAGEQRILDLLPAT